MSPTELISREELLELHTWAKANNHVLVDLTEIVAPTLNLDSDSITMHTYVLDPGTIGSRSYIAPKAKLS